MKKLIFTLIFFILSIINLNAQSSASDKIICIIDTTKCYVKFSGNGFYERNPELNWTVTITGHYYDYYPPYKDLAKIIFYANDMPNISGRFDYEPSFQIRMLKEELIKYRFLDETWFHTKTSADTLLNITGEAQLSNAVYFVFKQAYKDQTSDSVTVTNVRYIINSEIE